MSDSATIPSINSVTQKACAKINLSLHITGRRDDGYHLLDSLVVFADYGDELVLSAAPKTSLDISGPFSKGLEAENDNLILQAHRVLSTALKMQLPPTHFQLTKNLPVSSGIGGGSADAAAALRGLINLWQLDVDNAVLSKCALKLGADVPVCLKTSTCQMQGTGEIITLVDHFAPLYIVLVNAGVTISTPSIFSTLDLAIGQPAFSALEPYKTIETQSQWIEWLQRSRNDLQNAAISQSDKINQTLDTITATENLLFSQMSGSGATCFGLYGSLSDAEKACRAIKQINAKSGRDWWVVAAPII